MEQGLSVLIGEATFGESRLGNWLVWGAVNSLAIDIFTSQGNRRDRTRTIAFVLNLQASLELHLGFNSYPGRLPNCRADFFLRGHDLTGDICTSRSERKPLASHPAEFLCHGF